MTERGAEQAESVLEELRTLVRRVGHEIVKVALREAVFREEDLPKRTAAFQKKYRKDNGA